jgi:SSS family solute:Na+ symporter
MDWVLAHADVAIIVIYMAAMLWIGWRVTDGSRDVEGFTVGNREMSGLVVGLSVLGTFLSSITFLALPAKVYESHNWNAYVFGMALPFAALVAVLYFIPLYRKRVHLSAYELLEQRFGYWARGYAAISYVVLQLLRVAMVLLLVGLAVNPLLGWGVVPTLVALGVVVIIYDVMGGIKAVIWTDVAQVFVLVGGALWCLYEMIFDRPGGLPQFWADIPPGSFSFGDFASWDLSKSTFLVIMLYGISENLRNYGTDQNYVQRMLCARDRKEADKSIWIGALSYLPISVIFCVIGTGLFVFYHKANSTGGAQLLTEGVDHTPLPSHAKPDEVFPHFIKHELPPVVRGAVIAGIMAAAMSTIDSCLNSMSMVMLVDLLRRFRRGQPRIPEIITLRLFTATSGILGTALAAGLYWAFLEESAALMDHWWKYAGVAGSGLFGLFLLAWLLPRVPSWGALVAVFSSIPVLVWGMMARPARGQPARLDWSLDNCPLHPNLVGIAGFGVLLVVGAAIWLAVRAGLVRPNPRAVGSEP